MKPTSKHMRLAALFAASALALAACGGGGDDDDKPGPGPGPGPGPNPEPVTETLTGQVTRNSALKNVVVCMDLNGNDACDAGEPTSAPTGEDGRYSITYEKSVVTPAQVAAASLIAPVLAGELTQPTTAIDMVAPTSPTTSSSYVLKRPPGTAGNINPLTTLLHVGMADGMSEAVARANIAKQLGVPAAKIDGYQDDPPSTALSVTDSARTAASITANALRDKTVLQVGDQSAAVASGEALLNSLWFADAGNYYFQTLDLGAKAAGADFRPVIDARSGKANGAVRADLGDPGSLYRGMNLTSEGWKYCTRDTPILVTLGTPSRSIFCNSRDSIGYSTSRSIAGQTMSDLVTRWQGQPSNSINTGGAATANLLAALGNTQFPNGSTESTQENYIVVPALTIDNAWTRGLPQNRATTVADLPAAYPVASVDLATGANTLSLGLGSGADKAMRVAFGAATDATTGEAQYYQCDLDPVRQVFTNPPNCVATVQGTYRIDTVHGVPVMRFVGAPATVMTFDVVYTQHDFGSGSWVLRAHETKPTLSARRFSTNRLNGPAWAAMKAQLGL